MTESAPVSSAVRPEPGIMITSFFVWKTSRRASVVGSSTPSSKLRSYWIDGGWLIAWMTGKGSSVGPGIMRTGRVWHWAQLIVRDTLVSFVGGTAEPVPVVGGLTKMRASRLRYSNRIICSNPIICNGGREAGSHRGWPERGPTRLRSSKNLLSVYLCRGGREAGSHRGWPERGPTRLRSSKNLLSVYLCRGGRGAGPHRGWRERAPPRPPSPKQRVASDSCRGAGRPDRIVGGLREARPGSVPPPIWAGDVSRGRGVRGGGR